MVNADVLVFNVTIFIICAVLTHGLLLVRRNAAIFGNAELGGPSMPKYFTFVFLVLLWMTYVSLSSMEAYHVINGF